MRDPNTRDYIGVCEGGPLHGQTITTLRPIFEAVIPRPVAVLSIHAIGYYGPDKESNHRTGLYRYTGNKWRWDNA